MWCVRLGAGAAEWLAAEWLALGLGVVVPELVPGPGVAVAELLVPGEKVAGAGEDPAQPVMPAEARMARVA